MASLANQTISSSYDGLVKTATDQPVGVSGVQLLEDGEGNSLALSVGRANQGVTVTGTLTATTVTGTLSATSVLANGVIATTQATSDNSTKVATTAYVKSVVTAEDLDIAGTTGTGSVDLDSQVLTIAGTANEIETVASGQTITIGLPSTITANVTGNVSGNLTGTVLTAAQANITSVGTLSSLAVSGSFAVDTNTLFVDTVGDRVLMGATVALQGDSLEVHSKNDGGAISVFGRASDNLSTIAFRANGANTKKAAIEGGDIGLSLITGVTERMRINSSGNVGIGTSSPNVALHISGVNEGSAFDITNTTASTGKTFRIASQSTGNLVFEDISAATERMRIDSSGVLLVGTTSAPTGAVAGTIVPHSGFLSRSIINKQFSTNTEAGTLTITLQTAGNIAAALNVYIFGTFQTENREGYAAFRVFCNRETGSVTTVEVQAPTNANGNFTTGFSFTATKPAVGTINLAIEKPSGAFYTVAIDGHIALGALTSVTTAFV